MAARTSIHACPWVPSLDCQSEVLPADASTWTLWGRPCLPSLPGRYCRSPWRIVRGFRKAESRVVAGRSPKPRAASGVWAGPLGMDRSVRTSSDGVRLPRTAAASRAALVERVKPITDGRPYVLALFSVSFPCVRCAGVSRPCEVSAPVAIRNPLSWHGLRKRVSDDHGGSLFRRELHFRHGLLIVFAHPSHALAAGRLCFEIFEAGRVSIASGWFPRGNGSSLSSEQRKRGIRCQVFASYGGNASITVARPVRGEPGLLSPPLRRWNRGGCWPSPLSFQVARAC